MIKVGILDRCKFCDGKAYVYVCEDIDVRGDKYDRYRPCEMCCGSGNRVKWVGLREFFDLLQREITKEPDYLELARKKLVW